MTQTHSPPISSRAPDVRTPFEPGSASRAADDAALEQRTMRKISLRLLPLLFALYVASQLDRANVAIAALQMNRALGLSAFAYTFGAGICFLSYALFEIPSNVILLRVGARRWIARIAISWGLLSCATMFARGPHSFSVLRFFLGVAEAGYAPGILFYLGRWYPERRRARAISRFMLGLPIASILGGPVGAALLGFDGWFGLAGWQWLFLVEGLPAIVFGIVALLMLTERPSEARWLSSEEKAWLANKLATEAEQAAPRDHGVLEALRNRTVWMIAVPYFFSNLAMLGINLLWPTVTKDVLHIADQRISLLVGGVGLLALAGMLSNGWHSDRTGERIMHVIVPVLLSTTGLLLAATSRQPIVIVASLAIVTICHSTMFPAFWCLPSFLRGAGAAAGIALINTIGSLGGFVGPNIVGGLKNATGSYSPAFYVLATLSLCGAALFARLRAARALVPLTV
jgi:ACS family tartrate transporter-like MFS transporter